MGRLEKPSFFKSGSRRLLAWAYCAAVLIAFAVTAALACRGKAPTADEPLHLVSAYLVTDHHDFRCDPEDPPLWKYFAVVPHGASGIHFDFRSSDWQSMLKTLAAEGKFVSQTLFANPDNDVDSLLAACRWRMIALGVALGALIALWAGKLAGPVASAASVTFFALDPNFLGHAPLLKNDVACSLEMLALVYCVWLLGRRITPSWTCMAALICAATVNTKFSGVGIVLIAMATLLFRALLPTPWPAGKTVLLTYRGRIASALGICLIAAAVSIAGCWACYGFRFAPTPDPNSRLNFDESVNFTAKAESLLAHPHEINPSQNQIDQWMSTWKPGLFIRVSQFINRRQVLPQAWIAGLVYARCGSLGRKAFLCGDFSRYGWWYYFPEAMAFKTPVASLVALLMALIVGVGALWSRLRGRKGHARQTVLEPGADVWSVCCLVIPPAVFMVLAILSHIDIGLRHVFPVYPFLYIGVGAAAAYAWRRLRKTAAACLMLLIAGLAAETSIAFPDYVSFFNILAGGARGGLNRLSDSNIDWGQDLKLLVEWQHHHPNQQLFLCVVGVDPRHYGLRYVRLPGNPWPGNESPDHTRPAVLAISAMNIQGTNWYPVGQNLYGQFRRLPPLTILGGSIYLFNGSGLVQ